MYPRIDKLPASSWSFIIPKIRQIIIQVINPGLEFSPDKTLRPKANSNVIVETKNVLTLDSIGISTDYIKQGYGSPKEIYYGPDQFKHSLDGGGAGNTYAGVVPIDGGACASGRFYCNNFSNELKLQNRNLVVS